RRPGPVLPVRDVEDGLRDFMTEPHSRGVEIGAAPRRSGRDPLARLPRIEREARQPLRRSAGGRPVIDFTGYRDARVLGADTAPAAFVDMPERAGHDQ